MATPGGTIHGDGTLPCVLELTAVPDPFDALSRFADLDGVLLFESATRNPHLGRYSFLAADPFHWFEQSAPVYGENPLVAVSAAMGEFAAAPVAGLPPFQGGAAGLLSYELGCAWERLVPPADDPLGFPVLAVGLYDCVLAWDHVADRAWIISQGLPLSDPASRRRRAVERLAWMQERLDGPPRVSRRTPPPAARVPLRSAAKCTNLPPGISSAFSREDYMAAVGRIIEYIRAGDVFQANLSQQLEAFTTASPLELYGQLRAVNSAPFSACFTHADWAVISASPERFLSVRQGQVETRPIKGTRPRSTDRKEDDRLRDELLASEKDRAENAMIVDLLRNDLSRVCRPGTIRVPQFCALESYATVHHLVSSVIGTLAADRSVWDLFAASFPGGSITGAPKVRAMEILREIEPTARGPYCGSLFYVGFDGSSDSSILIRTMAAKNGRVRIGVGGGVTAASDPAEEYEETLTKARGVLEALNLAGPPADLA